MCRQQILPLIVIDAPDPYLLTVTTEAIQGRAHFLQAGETAVRKLIGQQQQLANPRVRGGRINHPHQIPQLNLLALVALQLARPTGDGRAAVLLDQLPAQFEHQQRVRLHGMRQAITDIAAAQNQQQQQQAALHQFLQPAAHAG
ncbi:spfh [Lasius niger]|uniref:Spfh n=1 Tax=Lasius niger TaxID=67767 RepID=A0A0J7JXL2_LASNI|nr:spfh [Lasius niger]